MANLSQEQGFSPSRLREIEAPNGMVHAASQRICKSHDSRRHFRNGPGSSGPYYVPNGKLLNGLVVVPPVRAANLPQATVAFLAPVLCLLF